MLRRLVSASHDLPDGCVTLTIHLSHLLLCCVAGFWRLGHDAMVHSHATMMQQSPGKERENITRILPTTLHWTANS